MSDAQSIWTALRRAEERCIAEVSAAERELQHTLYGYESRLVRLRYAINASGPLACRTLETTLEGIKLDAIWKILYSIVHDIALYYGGSVVAGTAMGAAAGSLAGGVGAAPGAAIGFGAGQLMGTWVMTFLGLKMLAEGLSDTIPQAFRLYWKAFRAVWGSIEGDPHDARYRADFALSEDQAAHHFAQGHVLMIMAILIALVAWLTRGSSEEALMQAVRQSERLGAKMADWLAENKQKLINHPRLQPVLRPKPEPVKEEAPQAAKRPRLPSKSTVSSAPPKAAVAPPSKSLTEVLNAKWGESNVADALAAKQANPALDGLLTDDEYLAIRGYTSNLYSQINPALRSGAAGDWQILADNASSGMDKLVANGYGYQGTVVRNAMFTDDQVASMFQPGGTFTEKGFMSTTSNMDGVFSGNVTFHVQSETGVSVASVSQYAEESEVLFKPNTTFNVLDATQDPATKTWNVFMTEAAPQ
jgi:hypothetical protein